MPMRDLNQTRFFVYQADAGDRYMKEVRRHFSDAVEGPFRRSVENLVASQRLKAPRFVFGERGFHLPVLAITTSRCGLQRQVVIAIARRCALRSSDAVKIFILSLA